MREAVKARTIALPTAEAAIPAWSLGTHHFRKMTATAATINTNPAR